MSESNGSSNNNSSTGGLVISEEVIAKIATMAVLDVEGVAGMVAKPADIKGLMKKDHAAKSVRVAASDTEVKIDLYISLKLGARIREVCDAVMHSVKENVQNMTGKVVDAVNVHIEDIDLVPAVTVAE